MHGGFERARFVIESSRQISAWSRSNGRGSRIRGAPRRVAARGDIGIDDSLLMKNKVIISCAVTGSAHTPTMSDARDHSREIAEQAIAAAEAGAAVLHLHARVPQIGRPTAIPASMPAFCRLFARPPTRW